MRARPATYRPPSYPNLTLTEALSWLAFGKYLTAEEIAQWRRRNLIGGVYRTPVFIRKKLEKVAEEQLIPWIRDGVVEARGMLQKDREKTVAKKVTKVPRKFIFDGVFIDPSVDVIYREVLGKRFFGKPNPNYRYVTIDARELETAQKRHSTNPIHVVDQSRPDHRAVEKTTERTDVGKVKVRPRSPSQKDLKVWYVEIHVPQNLSRERYPLKEEELTAKQHFGRPVPREWLKALRKLHAPEGWKARGRPSCKK